MPAPVPQPPINRLVRPTEAHDFWSGAVVALIGILVLVGGLIRVTAVETLDGDAAWETQLVRAFSVGGLKYTAPGIPTPDGVPPDPDIGPTASDQPARFTETNPRKTARVRVDIAAAAPCPT